MNLNNYTGYLIAITITGMLFLLGACAPVSDPAVSASITDAAASHTGTGVEYAIDLALPTPCHAYTHEASIVGDDLIVDIEVTASEDEMCAQVIEPVSLTGHVEGSAERMIVRVNGEQVRAETVAPQAPSGGGDLDAVSNVTLTYAEGLLSYSFDVWMPSVCHTMNVSERIMESFPPQVGIDVSFTPPPEGTACILILKQANVNGTVDLGTEPGSVSITIDGEHVASFDQDDIENV